jgi:hypothetical protein
MHVFDNTVMPPNNDRYNSGPRSAWLDLRSASMVARAYPSTGEVFNTDTKQRIVALQE